MRHNPVKRTLAQGGRAFGAMVFEFFSPGLPQICKNAGADYVSMTWSIRGWNSTP